MISYDYFLKEHQRLFPDINVSRETFDRLLYYVQKVIEYNQSFNLIGSGEKEKIWERHVFDSMQLYPHIEENKKICDIGSGAGFPGMVLGIMGVSGITLIESNEKKATFLKNVSRETLIDNIVLCERVEHLKKPFDVITARAVSPLKNLLLWTQNISHKETQYIFPKGKKYQEEITEAYKKFAFDVVLHHSVTNENGRILVIKNVHKNNCRR